jgi:Spy/CpxP family protein refolding chaperone
VTDRPRALAVLIAVFLLGCIVGSAGSYMWLRNSPDPEQRAMRDFSPGSPLGGRRMAEFLKLTQEQESRYQEIMTESFRQLEPLRSKQEPLNRQLNDLRREQEPQVQAIISETNRRIMSILNEEQQKQFSSFLKDMGNSRRHPPHGGRGMGPPPARP